MSSISLKAGDTGWTDSITCDLCGVKVERKDTGELCRVPKSVFGIPLTLRTMDSDRTMIEYMERRFEKDALVGWGNFSADVGGDELAPRARLDFCPACAGVEQDSLLERSVSGGFGTYPEVEYGKEVPAEVGVGTTNLGAVRELAEAIAPGYPVPSDIADQIDQITTEMRAANVRRTRAGGTAHCIWREGTANDDLCGRPAMTGSWYCYEHAARSAP